MTHEEIFNIEFVHDVLNKITVRQYFRELLLTLWDEGESFSGKRPFGNSGWDYDLLVPLIKHGVIAGSLDEDGYVVDYNKGEYRKLINVLISQL